MAAHIETVHNQCSGCGSCVHECHFLTRFGNPGQLADTYDPDHPESLTRPFQCHLCGLCTSVCPTEVDPARMFLEMRREAFLRGVTDLPEHRGLRRYERTGTSKRYSWYALPEGCDTIFFPGCALVGTRSTSTWKTFKKLQEIIPGIGIVLDCCNKITNELGDSVQFNLMFSEMCIYLAEHGIKNVLVACPNCNKIFNQYAAQLTTRTIYEVLAANPLTTRPTVTKTVTVHDPCVSRHDSAAQEAVRRLLEGNGFMIEEMQHSKSTTLCCGEGGGAGCLVPDQAQQLIAQRLEEAQGLPIVSYCAGCTNSFGKPTTASHILDLLFAPQTALTEKHRITKAPLTYYKRLKFKHRIRKEFPTAVSRERNLRGERETLKRSLFIKLIITAFLVLFMFTVHKKTISSNHEQQDLKPNGRPAIATSDQNPQEKIVVYRCPNHPEIVNKKEAEISRLNPHPS